MLSVAAAVGTPRSSAASQHVAPHPELPAFFPVDMHMHGELVASLILSGKFFTLLAYLSQIQQQGKGNPGNQVCTNSIKTAPKIRWDALCAEESI